MISFLVFNSCFFYLKRFVSNKKTTNFCFLDLQFSKHFFFNFQFNSIALQECLRVFNTLHPFWTFYLIAVMAFCWFFWKLGAHQNLCDVICPYLKIVIFRCAIFCGIQQKSRYSIKVLVKQKRRHFPSFQHVIKHPKNVWFLKSKKKQRSKTT